MKNIKSNLEDQNVNISQSVESPTNDNKFKKKYRELVQKIFDIYSKEIFYYEGEIYTSKKVMTFEIEEYSAIAAVGGDGTIHETINGLLKRPDGKRVPIALLPNGSGNDACGGIMVDTMAQAL